MQYLIIIRFKIFCGNIRTTFKHTLIENI